MIIFRQLSCVMAMFFGGIAAYPISHTHIHLFDIKEHQQPVTSPNPFYFDIMCYLHMCGLIHYPPFMHEHLVMSFPYLVMEIK